MNVPLLDVLLCSDVLPFRLLSTIESPLIRAAASLASSPNASSRSRLATLAARSRPTCALIDDTDSLRSLSLNGLDVGPSKGSASIEGRASIEGNASSVDLNIRTTESCPVGVSGI